MAHSSLRIDRSTATAGVEPNAPEEINLREIGEKFFDFLSTFQEEFDEGSGDEQSNTGLYIRLLGVLVEQQRRTLDVDFKHIEAYDRDLAYAISGAFTRVEPTLKRQLHLFVKRYQEDYVDGEDHQQREFWLSFLNFTSTSRMRDLRTEELGKLIAFRGTVTRTGEVRPELFLAAFKCNECGECVRNIEQQYKYTQPLICTNAVCGNRQNWELIREESEFVDWQRAKVQEDPDEVPPGSLPRTVDVILRHELVEGIRAGDKTVFTGSLITVPDVGAISTPGEKIQASFSRNSSSKDSGVQGPKMLGTRELTYKLGFLANSTKGSAVATKTINIRDEVESSPEEILNEMEEEHQETVRVMAGSPHLYRDLANSLAPGVHGHEDVKRSILLMLLGGVHKKTAEGINLRGDINIAIVGDPGCAKSQMLKYVANFLPRAVYTSGKSSSAAGLTASVVKEPDSNEFCIEAGALMLADNGICCIDEFDKMDEKDQVAIHEAMEQQTISIAKAGIQSVAKINFWKNCKVALEVLRNQATLNARTSILAAANPSGGRYDKSKPLRQNVGLPPAILSRFDLLHIMVDEADEVEDTHIARHIVKVHREQAQELPAKYTTHDLQRYIRYARSFKPVLSREANHALKEGYKRMRESDAVPGASRSYRMTVRQLEALIRLSEALARMRCTPVIRPQFVKEAIRLMQKSNISIEVADTELDDVDGADAMYEDVQTAFNQQDSPSPAPQEDPASPVQDTPMNGADYQAEAEDEAARQAEEMAKAQQGIADLAGHGVRQDAPLQPQPARISRQKLNLIKNLLVSKLRSLEGEAEVQEATVGSIEVPVMTQHDLLAWYFHEQMARGVLTSNEEAQQELLLVSKIVQHLIRREGVLIVVESPTREPGEDDRTFAKRQQRERVLAVAPTYTDE